jgi:acetylornithine deacetylase
VAPAYELYADFVVEEEVGGNGTLASILNGCPADEVVVLEPTSLDVFRGHRGCLSFEIDVRTEGAHMGSGNGLSAIDGAVAVLAELRRLERRLTREARLDEDFRRCRRPTPVNVGFVQGGEWHGSVPSRCSIRGNVGFLPRYRISDVKATLDAAVSALPDPWSRDNCRLTYSGLHNGAYVIPEQTPLVERLQSSRRRRLRKSSRAGGWSASCDARYYNTLLGLPVVIFGSGDLADAHSQHERVSIAQLASGMSVLADFLATGRAT